MATRTLTYKTELTHGLSTKGFVRKSGKLIRSLIPRPRTILSVGLILAGLCVPFLMFLEWIPATLFLGFVGLACAATGGVLVLFYSGEL
jgi:hypothetical protein